MSDLDKYFALYNEGAYREAYSVLRNLMAAQPYWSKVGDAYVLCADLEMIINDDVSKALELLDKARRLGCRSMSAYHRTHGYALYKAGEYDRGIQELEKCVALDPDIVNLATLGKALSYEGDGRAADVWRRVLEIDAHSCIAYIYLGILATKTGDREKAVLLAKQAEELHPTALDMEEIATLYAEAGEIQIALGKYLELERLAGDPKGPLYGAIAACYFELGNVQEGCTYLERARRCSPDSIDVKTQWERYHNRCVGQ
jgi:tetratricopeptide (TPR) repeat protein